MRQMLSIGLGSKHCCTKDKNYLRYLRLRMSYNWPFSRSEGEGQPSANWCEKLEGFSHFFFTE